jgi:hypothetical protein
MFLKMIFTANKKDKLKHFDHPNNNKPKHFDHLNNNPKKTTTWNDKAKWIFEMHLGVEKRQK